MCVPPYIQGGNGTQLRKSFEKRYKCVSRHISRRDTQHSYPKVSKSGTNVFRHISRRDTQYSYPKVSKSGTNVCPAIYPGGTRNTATQKFRKAVQMCVPPYIQARHGTQLPKNFEKRYKCVSRHISSRTRNTATQKFRKTVQMCVPPYIQARHGTQLRKSFEKRYKCVFYHISRQDTEHSSQNRYCPDKIETLGSPPQDTRSMVAVLMRAHRTNGPDIISNYQFPHFSTTSEMQSVRPVGPLTECPVSRGLSVFFQSFLRVARSLAYLPTLAEGNADAITAETLIMACLLRCRRQVDNACSPPLPVHACL
jgi:nitrate reductase cytochrome c-type subunit